MFVGITTRLERHASRQRVFERGVRSCVSVRDIDRPCGTIPVDRGSGAMGSELSKNVALPSGAPRGIGGPAGSISACAGYPTARTLRKPDIFAANTSERACDSSASCQPALYCSTAFSAPRALSRGKKKRKKNRGLDKSSCRARSILRSIRDISSRSRVTESLEMSHPYKSRCRNGIL